MSGQLSYQTFEFSGLGTLAYVVRSAGFYTVQSKSQIVTPTSSGTGQQSGLVTTIKLNGSTVTNGTSATGSTGMTVSGISCAVGDTLSVVYSSSVATDSAPNINVIQSQVVIFQGS